MNKVVIFSDDSELRDLVHELDDYQVLYFSTELNPDKLPDRIDLAIFDFDVVPLTLLDEWSQFPRLHIRKMAVVSAENIVLIDDVLGQLDNYVVRPFKLPRLKFRIGQLMNLQPSDVIPNMSFELRTPLTTIMGYAKFMLHYYMSNEQLPLEEKIDYLNHILNSGQRLGEMINFIFNMINIEQVKNYYFWTTDVGKLLDSTNNFEQKSQTLNIYNPDKSLKVHCDMRKIDFVIDSILHNASRHSEENAEINLYITTEHGYILFGIRDYGEGISKSVVEHVFTQRHGYSLYLCKQIIEMHGGKIWFESELDVGTTFYFTLPLAE